MIRFCDNHGPNSYVPYDPAKCSNGCPVCHPETEAQEGQDNA